MTLRILVIMVKFKKTSALEVCILCMCMCVCMSMQERETVLKQCECCLLFAYIGLFFLCEVLG